MAGSLSDPDVLAAVQAARMPPAGVPGTFASPPDWRDGWIYFLMADRFDNPGGPPVHQPYDDPNYFSFQGGTFRGVRPRAATWCGPANCSRTRTSGGKGLTWPHVSVATLVPSNPVPVLPSAWT